MPPAPLACPFLFFSWLLRPGIITRVVGGWRLLVLPFYHLRGFKQHPQGESWAVEIVGGVQCLAGAAVLLRYSELLRGLVRVGGMLCNSLPQPLLSSTRWSVWTGIRFRWKCLHVLHAAYGTSGMPNVTSPSALYES